MAEQVESGALLGRSLRVLAVVPGSSGRVAMPFVERQLASLRRAGVDVRAFCLESRTGLRELIGAARAFRRTIETFRPDIVHAHYGTMTSFFAAVTTNLPLVITFRGSDLNMARDVSGLRAYMGYWLSQLAAVRARHIICVSRQLRSRLWWRKGRTTVLPSGIDLALFVPTDKALARRALGLPGEARIALFYAGHRPQLKGLDLFREAVRVAESKVGPIRAIELTGQVAPEAMPRYLSAADCVVLASLREGSPNIVKEAMACNVPLACVDVGDVRERLHGVQNSLIVRRDAGELGGAIAHLVRNAGRSNGRERIAHLSEASVAAAIKNIYQEIAGSAAGAELDVAEQLSA